MKKKYICMILATSLMMGSVSFVFAGTNSVAGVNTLTGATTYSAITTSGTAITTTGSAVTTSGPAVTNSGTTIEGIAIPQITETKKLSLEEAIKIMKTSGASAEAAELNRQSDIAVGNGYSETVKRIKKTEDRLDLLSSIPASALPSDVNPVDMEYEAQVAGVTSNNKKIMQLRRDFARANAENNYKAELNQIEADTISLYYKVLLAQDNLKIAKDNLVTQQKTLKNVDLKKSVGLLSKKDVLLAESSVSDAESTVRSAETQLAYAKMSFNYLLGYNVKQEVVFTDTLDKVAAAAGITAEDTAVQNALNNRIELKGATFAIKVYDVLLKDVSMYPKNSSTYLNAKISLLEAQKTAKDATSKIEIDIRNKYDLVQDKKAAVDAAKELLNYAIEGERLMELTNEEGISTVEELLTAQVSLYKAKLNLANANSEYALALKSYEFAQGVGTTRITL